jgi:hypothetical protein
VRRRRRILLNALTILSLLLCAALAALWVRGYRRLDSIGYATRSGNHYTLISFGGAFHLQRIGFLPDNCRLLHYTQRFPKSARWDVLYAPSASP